MNNIIIFAILSLPVIYISRRSLLHPRSHGFPRFFAWECILWLLVENARFWFTEPFSNIHIVSWVLLFGACYPVVAGTLQLKKQGKAHEHRDNGSLYNFEKTTQLVDSGIYRYIRHPLYCSLIILTWGICLKNITLVTVSVAGLSSILLYFTARLDEKECITYFGEPYQLYMNQSKMFIPFIF
jgi:protein-S-isoprenylcysteine O-methyltransferase Ste14